MTGEFLKNLVVKKFEIQLSDIAKELNISAQALQSRFRTKEVTFLFLTEICGATGKTPYNLLKGTKYARYFKPILDSETIPENSATFQSNLNVVDDGTNTIDRLKQFIDYKEVSIRAFEIHCGFSNGSIHTQVKNNKAITSDRLEIILNTFGELDANWLLAGTANMLKADNDSEKQALSEERYIAALKDQIEELKKDKVILTSIIQSKI